MFEGVPYRRGCLLPMRSRASATEIRLDPRPRPCLVDGVDAWLDARAARVVAEAAAAITLPGEPVACADLQAGKGRCSRTGGAARQAIGDLEGEFRRAGLKRVETDCDELPAAGESCIVVGGLRGHTILVSATPHLVPRVVPRQFDGLDVTVEVSGD